MRGCSELTTLDLSNFDTKNATNMYHIFVNCGKLITIYASDKFVTDKFQNGLDTNDAIIDSRDMFNGCTSLVGGSGTTYNSSNVDKTYAHIDGGTSNPGYFTVK